MDESFGFIGFIFIGILAGWIASKLMKGQGSGLIINLVIGVIGASLGGWLMGFIGFSSAGFLGSLITSVIGAVALLWVIGLIRK